MENVHGNIPPIIVKIPKNVRQIGQVNDMKKIYVEDYVISFLKKAGAQKETTGELFVLLGQFVKINSYECIFVSGAIQIKDSIFEENLIFSNEVWTQIYNTIKKYFTNVEIVGWSFIRAGLPLEVDDRIRKAHSDNFAGQDKILLLYDSLEREEAFFIYEDNFLSKQTGYYIFYDKNQEMQDYIIALKDEKKQEKQQSLARQTFMPSQKPDNSQKPNQVRKRPAYLYGVGAAAAILVLVFSSTMLNSYNKKVQGLEDSIDAISENVEKQTQVQASPNPSIKDSLPVETARGKVSTINEEKEKEEVTQVKETVEPEEKKPEATKKIEKQEKPKEKEVVAKKEYYIIKEGDTLISIAVNHYGSKKYVKNIQAANGLKDSDMIKVGQKIELP